MLQQIFRSKKASVFVEKSVSFIGASNYLEKKYVRDAFSLENFAHSNISINKFPN